MSIVASRYGRALAEVVAHHKIAPENAVSQLNQIAELVKTSAALSNVLRSPAVPQRQKLALLDQIFSRTGGDRQMRNFVAAPTGKRPRWQICGKARQSQKEIDCTAAVSDTPVTHPAGIP